MPKTKHALFIAIVAVVVSIFWRPLWILSALSIHRDEYSHIVFIPLIVISLIYWRRRTVFANSVFPTYAGAIFLFVGLTLYGLTTKFSGTSAEPNIPSLSLSIIGCIVSCVGALLLSYGWSAVRASLFPLGCLFFAVPLPDFMLTRLVYGLQQGSSDVAALLLRTFGVHFFRYGLVFQLSGFTIEVAPECSGIRSSIALLISTVLLSQFLLRSNWRKLALCMFVLPLAMFKNGLRIATLSTLSVYVSRDFLYGWLHHSGGVVFFLIGIAFIYLALRVFQFNERPFVPGTDRAASVSQSARKAEI